MISQDSRTPKGGIFRSTVLVTFVQPTITKEATCIYTMTPDENFIVDEDDGMVILAGFLRFRWQ